MVVVLSSGWVAVVEAVECIEEEEEELRLWLWLSLLLMFRIWEGMRGHGWVGEMGRGGCVLKMLWVE